MRSIGLGGYSLHSLRHSAATSLIKAGYDAHAVATQLGHSDPRITLSLYTSTFEKQKAEMGAALGAKLQAAREAVGAEVGAKPASNVRRLRGNLVESM